MVMFRLNVILLVMVPLTALSVTAGEAKKPSPVALQFFENKVRPILAENCFQCHGEKKQRGSLKSLRGRIDGD